MNRIGIEDVRNAYRVTGLHPAAAVCEDRRDGCADPLTAWSALAPAAAPPTWPGER